MASDFLTQPLNAKHNRASFSCGESVLDAYLQKYAKHDQKRSETAVFILTSHDHQIIGFYTLSALSVHMDEFPADILKKLRLSSYRQKPATLLGRLAIDEQFQGQHWGTKLLIDALKRSFIQSKQVGSLAVVVDALNDNAARFYHKFGFIPFPSQPLRLFLPIKTINKLF